ncbi:MAG: methyltransferase domain-containing protein [Smithella sp.]
MAEQIRQLLKKVYLDGVATELSRASRHILFCAARKLKRVDHRIIEKYFNAHEIRKLHIGCGDHVLDGWLNTDFFPKSATVVHLDATRRFPFCDEEFDYIFCEHMIEHISYSQGLAMLSECCRVLRKNGRIRISTPDLAFLIDLYKEEKSDLQKEYIKWASDSFLTYAPCNDDTFVINNFVRDWGHQFIYDEKTLSESMEMAGFTNVTRCELDQSKFDALRNLENKNRVPKVYLILETMILEATKLPAGDQGA